MADAAIVQKIKCILDEIRPRVQLHDGNIELVRFEDGIVYIKMQGACIGCPASFYTVKLGIEQALKEQIPDVMEVVPVDE